MIFTTPSYTLPIINALPPLSTNAINDDNILSSAISKLNSNQFTYSSGNNDALSESTLVTTPKSPRKRRKLATFI